MKMNLKENTKLDLNTNENIPMDGEGSNSCCKNKNKNPARPMLYMILCCGIPMVIIALLLFIARYNPGVAMVLGFIAPFICPLMMVGMIFMLFGKNK